MMPRRSRLAALFLALAALPLARPAAAQTLTVDSADSNTPDAITAAATYTTAYDGYNATGEIDHSAGTLTVGTPFTSDQALFIAYGVGSTGTYDLSGTAVLVSTNFTAVGTFGTGVFNQTGGTANFNGGFDDSLAVGNYNGSVGTYNQTAGTTNASGVTVSDYAGSTGTYNLNGGTLITEGVFGGANGGTNSTFNFNGGTLQAAATDSLMSGLTTVNVRNGGAIIDTDGNDVSMYSALSHSAIKGDAATDGGLTKNGSGNIKLFANSTYTGRTLVNAGALFVDNTPAKAGDSGTGTGSVYVNTGAWLGGLGTIGGSVVVGSGAPMTGFGGIHPQFSVARGTLTPGDNTITVGTLAINGSLTLTPGLSMTEMDLGDPASTGSDLIKVGGNLSIGGDLQLTLAAGFKPTALETFTLIDVTGTGTTTGTFENTTANGTLYTDANGNVFLISYAADADEGLAFNDVTATFLGVPEPSTWASLALGGAALVGAWRGRRLRRA